LTWQSVILPIAGQGMVAVAWLQRLVGQQGGQDGAKVGIECCPVLALGFALIITLNCPV
jgi:hypothetical protein